MFHTSLGSLHADCRRCAGRVRWPAHPGYWQNRPRNAPQGGQANSLDFPGPDNCSRLYTVASSLFRGAVLNLARLFLDYRHHRNRQQEDGHSDGEDCEICGLGGSRSYLGNTIARFVYSCKRRRTKELGPGASPNLLRRCERGSTARSARGGGESRPGKAIKTEGLKTEPDFQLPAFSFSAFSPSSPSVHAPRDLRRHPGQPPY
jgi:hypothetical protein